MNYCEFKEMLGMRLGECLKGRASVSFQVIPKENRVKKEVVVIEETESGECRMIPAGDLYESYNFTGDFEKCVQEVLYLCGEEPFAGQKDVPKTWEEARGMVQMRLVKKDWNLEMLEQVLYREYLDFAVIFAVQVRKTEEMNASVTVDERLAGMWKVGTRELWEAALENLEREAFTIETVESLLEGVVEGFCPDESSQDEALMYVITNRNRLYGARAVLRKDVVRKLADSQKCSLYLLPSSVHEWILCRDDGETDVDMMKQLVCEINGNPGVISPEECLSDSIYYYDWEQDEVGIVA